MVFCPHQRKNTCARLLKAKLILNFNFIQLYVVLFSTFYQFKFSVSAIKLLDKGWDVFPFLPK